MPATDALSLQDAAHLLRRSGFGGREAEIAALTGMMRRGAVDAVMGFTAAGPIPEGPDVGVPGWVGNESQWEAQTDGIAWWIQRMADLPNPTAVPGSPPAVAGSLPICEKLTLF